MRQDRYRFSEIDQAALTRALLALLTCPNCRGPLLPVQGCPDVFGCSPCRETWYIPQDKD